jgi:hypothetical protein
MFDPFTYMQDKDLLVIGNAVTDKEIDYSKYNCIVRINLGIQTKPIDVWVNNLVHKAHETLGEIPDFKNIIRLNAEKDGKRMAIDTQWKLTKHLKLMFIHHTILN